MCVFCKIIAGEIPATKVFENESVFAFLDINPIEKGHLLVVPKRHCEFLEEAPPDDLCELISAVQKLTRAVRTFASGANVMQNNGKSAGQEVPHLHFHVIPRYGTIPFTWKSGAAKYGSDAERDEFAGKIKAVI